MGAVAATRRCTGVGGSGPDGGSGTSAGGAGSVDPVEKARFGDDAIVERRVIAVDPGVDHDNSRTSTGAALRIDDIGLHRDGRLIEQEVERPGDRVPLDHAALLELGESFGARLDRCHAEVVESTDDVDIRTEKRDGAGVTGHERRSNERCFFLLVGRRHTHRSGDESSDEHGEHGDDRWKVPEMHGVLTTRPARAGHLAVIDNNSNEP